MLHLRPELAHMEALVDEPASNFMPYDVYPTNIGLISLYGVLFLARTANAEKSRRIAEDYDGLTIVAIRREFALAPDG